MEKRRSKLEIYLEILHLVHRGVNKPTRVMYGANLSWVAYSKWSTAMVEQGLLVKKGTASGDAQDTGAPKRSKFTYELTDKGASAINYFKGFDLVNFDLPPPRTEQENPLQLTR